MKFELTSWLQIEDAGPRDSGTYRCVARNDLGSVSATAVLGVLGPGGCSGGGSRTVDRLEHVLSTQWSCGGLNEWHRCVSAVVSGPNLETQRLL